MIASRIVLATFVLWAPLAASAAPALVDGDWVTARLDDPDTLVLDVRSAIDGGSRDTYARSHVPGAVHTDYLLAGWRSEEDGVQGVLPGLDKLEILIGNLGIDEDVHVVVVPAGESASDLASAARVYWTLKVAGHDAVSILDGGFALWQRQGRTVEAGVVEPEPRLFEIELRADLTATLADVEAAARAGQPLIDNRDEASFRGATRHPWVARAGAIPGAASLPVTRLVDGSGGRLLPRAELAALWHAATPSGAAAIAYCNTGHLSALGWFVASEILGRADTKLFDGSLAQWASDPERALVAGTAAAPASWTQARAGLPATRGQ